MDLKYHIKFKTAFFALFAMLLLLFLALLVPREVLPISTAQDKAQHFLYFFILSALCWLSVKYRWWIQIALLVSTAALTEIGQLLTPNRHASWMDFQANLAGIAAAYLVILLIQKLLFSKGNVQ